MRQKTMYSVQPDIVEIISLGYGRASVRLRENIQSVPVEEGEQWEADEYITTTQYSESLEQTVRDNFENWLNHAKKQDYEATAEDIRKLRNALLTESDREMVMDRLGFDIPETVTTASLLSAVKSLFTVIRNATSGEWAEYRQKLRDLTTQPGFPYDVTFPDKPMFAVKESANE